MNKQRIESLYINLRSSKDRHDYMERHLSEFRPSTERFCAYMPSQIPLIGDRSAWLCSDREMAAFYSHLMAIRSLLSGTDFIMVFEDDIQLFPSFSVEKILSSAPDDFDILQLGTNCPGELNRLASLRKETGANWIRWEPGFWGAFAYIVRTEAARRIVNRYIDNNMSLIIRDQGRPDTSVADILLYCDCNSYASTFPFVANCTGFKSEIRAEDDPSVRWVEQAREIAMQIWDAYSGKG